MTAKENAPTSAATLAEAAEMTTCGAPFPFSDSTTAAANRQRKVSDLLATGRENAIPLRHLTALLDIDGRSVRLKIERERRSGTPICTDNHSGYYLPATEDEKFACVRSLRHRAGEILRTARAIEQAER